MKITITAGLANRPSEWARSVGNAAAHKGIRMKPLILAASLLMVGQAFASAIVQPGVDPFGMYIAAQQLTDDGSSGHCCGLVQFLTGGGATANFIDLSSISYDPAAASAATPSTSVFSNLSGSGSMGFLSADASTQAVSDQGRSVDAGAGMTLEFFDSLVYQNDSLSAGSIVQVSLNGFLSSTASETDVFACIPSFVLAGPGSPYPVDDACAPLPQDSPARSFSSLQTVEVGQPFWIVGQLTISAGSGNLTGQPGFSGSSAVSGSASYFVTAMAEGGTFTSASGHDYSLTASPEPGTCSLLSSGFAVGLIGILRRRRQRR